VDPAVQRRHDESQDEAQGAADRDADPRTPETGVQVRVEVDSDRRGLTREAPIKPMRTSTSE
jgi:hypothetical protein